MRTPQISRLIFPLAVSLALLGCTTGPATAQESAAAPKTTATGDRWFDDGRAAVAAAKAHREHRGRAKNIILFIGDGMSLDTISAARIFAGQQRGQSGEENWLAFERLPHTALMKTYNTNMQVPDSAGTATAMLSGVKTKAGVIGVNDNVTLSDCATVPASTVTSFLELMEERGRATGVVSTARITHATPASAYAHSPNRNWEIDGQLPPEATACKDIARQLIEHGAGDGLEVALGGGRAAFMPSDSVDPEYPEAHGARSDGRDLIGAWRKHYGERAAYVWNSAQFDALDATKTDKLLGLFEPSHMQFEADRVTTATEPSIAAMTRKAIEILRRDEDGFFLLVEGGRIDHAHHNGNASRALQDTVAFDDAVSAALAMVDLDETLIIVTADHGHVMSFSGYPTRGNPILGTVTEPPYLLAGEPKTALDLNGLPYTTLSYANGPGYRGAAGRPDLSKIDTEALDYRQEATVPLESETHSGTDVIAYADGAGAWLMRGVQEQNYIYHAMRAAAGE